jgi:adenosylcobinamide kinase / adenosylcobinamide-phosphate guanylyltransferase
MIYFITGGTRSGKSSFAMRLAKQLTANPVYVATARHWDDDFEKRIERHKSERDESWTSLEEEKNLTKHDFTGKVVVIDCVTLWLTNFFVDFKNDSQLSLDAMKAEVDNLKQQQATFIIISNEIGMGVHAETEIGRKFTDLQGWVNQYIAQEADTVVFMVSGIAMTIKNETK